MSEFLAMGGYAWYVWPAYAITLLALVMSVLMPIRRHKDLKAQLTGLVGQRENTDAS
ncbi:MAG: heme exporter protein CcmD [Arenicellales bacterium]|jgi:heme exporter protein D